MTRGGARVPPTRDRDHKNDRDSRRRAIRGFFIA